MTTIANVDERPYTFTKGAPDFVLKSCSHYLDKNGNKVEINEDFTHSLK